MNPLASLVSFVGVSDLEVADRFYGHTLGLSLVDDRPFALVCETAGSMLRITRVEQVNPQPHTVLGWRVADIDSAVEELTSRGISFVRYDGLEQNVHGVWRAPNGAQVAWFLDPDGNNLSLTQFPDSV